MAARVTRSASGGSRSTDAMFAEPHQYRNEERMMTKMLDQLKNGRLPAELLPLLRNFHTAVMESPCSRCHLLALSHDELGVIFDGLADPLQPVVAVAFSSTCKGLRTPLRAALEVLEERHVRSEALCYVLRVRWDEERHVPVAWSCAHLREAESLTMANYGLAADHMATLGMLLSCGSLPRLLRLYLGENGFGDEGVQALLEGMGRDAAPLLHTLYLTDNQLGPRGAEALAAALGRGAMRKLRTLSFGSNPIGNQGVATLAVPLRKTAVKTLYLPGCEIGDEGIASLFADLNKEDFKMLDSVYLAVNPLTDTGCAMIVSAIDSGRMPLLETASLIFNDHVSVAARAAIAVAIVRRKERKVRSGHVAIDSDSD